MKTLIIAMIILAGSTFIAAQTTERIEVKNGGQKVSKNGRITVKFVELIEDSRCPADVNCVWAGIARIKVRLIRGRKTSEVELNTMDKKSTLFHGWTFALTDLQPRQSTTSKYSPSAYTATITVSRPKT